ncbi:protein unc-79 homolog [Saccostrea cucullata]|uniref:protein unc-79 homolog n=1 Tax=Saccostrea cuccullata TaxID=36930 RepID=UPI002ED0BEC8
MKHCQYFDTSYVCDWLDEVAKTHFEVIVSCLLPHPVEYARVGGFWDTLCSRTVQIKEGLNCFFCLVPYDVITFEIWDYVMPYWLEAIRTEVPSEDLHHLKVLLNKSFDMDLCPLPFGTDSDKMYHFISERFDDSSAYVQEQALQWLQILSTLDIYLPIHMLLSMFISGVQNMTELLKQQSTAEPESPTKESKPSQPRSFPQNSPEEECPPPLSPAKSHVVVEAFEIYDRETELVLPCYIMMLDLILKQLELQNFPKYLGLYNETSRQIMQLLTLMLGTRWDGTHICSDEQQANSCMFCQNTALWHQVTSQVMQNFCPLSQVKIPTKEIPRVDESKRLSTTPTCMSRKSSVTSNDDVESTAGEKEEECPGFDMTSMPLHLQLHHAFLQELENTKDTDAGFALLTSMKYLILNGECLNYTVTQFPEYVKFSLSKYLIPK